jgi:hypothetical protein
MLLIQKYEKNLNLIRQQFFSEQIFVIPVLNNNKKPEQTRYVGKSQFYEVIVLNSLNISLR